ncbi:MAG: hypothetical protein IBJ03_03205 [Gemmatimonadaceae bacterium]|nr:hypothetical protein [Gemmatimonadaceae bacterium]
MDTVTQWLASVGWTAFAWAFAGLLIVNGAAAILWVMQGSRETVQKWTSAWLAANLLLVTIGLGVPTLTTAARLGIAGARAVTPNATWATSDTSN